HLERIDDRSRPAAAIELRSQRDVGDGVAAGQPAQTPATGAFATESEALPFELLQAREREHEPTEHPRVLAVEIRRVVGNRRTHVEGGRWKETGIVDDALEQRVQRRAHFFRPDFGATIVPRHFGEPHWHLYHRRSSS